MALLVSRIHSLRNHKDVSSMAFQVPLVGTGEGTRRSLGMIRFLMHLVRNVRWFSITWEFLLATFMSMNQPWLPMAFSVKKLGFIPQRLVFGAISMF